MTPSKKGALLAIGAYALWGLFPLYWKQLHSVPAQEIVAHRVIWACVFLLLVTGFKGEFRKTFSLLKKPGIVLVYGAGAALLTINWLTYVWAVNAGYIVDASLGYFINPLVSVFLGLVFFQERLRIFQWAAIILAGSGVGYLTYAYGSLPWIGLVLAFSFGIYGLIKKIAPLEALEGQTLEMALLCCPALFVLVFLEFHHKASFGHSGLFIGILLFLGGVVTATPLLMFSSAARRIPLSMIGILQYLAPTLQFLIGVWVYHELFPYYRLIGFSLIWSALAIYSLEGYIHRRKSGR